MKGLVIKDVLNLAKYLKTVFFVMVLYAVIFIPNNMGSAVSGMVILMMTMSVITSLSYDEMAKWDKYALTMPISRKDIVKSKYVVMVLLSLIGSLMGILLGSVAGFISHNLVISQVVAENCVVFAVAVIMGSMILPLLYRFGVERSRILMILVFLIPTFLVVGGIYLAKNFGLSMTVINEKALITGLSVGLPILLVVSLVCSYFVSVKIYSKKDL